MEREADRPVEVGLDTLPGNEAWSERKKTARVTEGGFDMADGEKLIEVRYCERCAQRSPRLAFDTISQMELCPNCRGNLERRRHVLRGLSAQSHTKH